MATDFTAHANIVSWWMLEEESGTRLDGSGNDNDLTDVNTVLFSADSKQGTNSAYFEAVNDEQLSITDGDHSNLDITGSMTFCFWIKPDTAYGSEYLLCKYESGTKSYRARLADGKAELRIGDGSSEQVLLGQAALNTGTWYHVACVFDAGNDMHLYIDGSTDSPGATASTALTAIADNSGAFALSGLSGAPSVGPYDGLMDEVAIFNAVLNASEINEIMDDGLAGSVTELSIEVSECEK